MGKIFFFFGGGVVVTCCLRKLTYPKPREKRRLDGNFNYTGTQSFITTFFFRWLKNVGYILIGKRKFDWLILVGNNIF